MKKSRLRIFLILIAIAVTFNSANAEGTNNLSRVDKLMVEGALHFSEGNLDKAIADFSGVIQLNPTNDFAILNRATAYRAKGEFAKSIKDWSKYILLNPTNHLAFQQRASCFAAIDEFDRALGDWNKSLRLDPNDATSLAMRGFCYNNKEQFDEALKDYYQAIQIDPKNASAWNNLGWLRATCPVTSFRNGKEAVEAATKACEFSDWKNWTRVDTLAAAFAEAGDFQQAIKFQEQALNLDETNNDKRKAMKNRLASFQKHQPFRQTPKR